MGDYASGKGYRRVMGNRPRASSNPDPGDRHLAGYPQAERFPVGRHGGPTAHHVETVGWMNGEFHEATHPNREAKRGTDGHLEKTADHSHAPLSKLNRVKMKPRS